MSEANNPSDSIEGTKQYFCFVPFFISYETILNTAVIMSHFLPQYIWLSTSGKEGLNEEKFKVLKGRAVILFPDLTKPDTKESYFELWSKKALEYKTIANISVCDYLERISSEKQKIEGWDIADYYIAYHKESL